MGCAFSSSTQIFVIDADHRQRRIDHQNNDGGGFSWFSRVRQGLSSQQQRRPSKIAGSAAFWLSKTKSGNDAVLVGQLKSNGAYSRRRPSNEAQFIEHRSRIALCNGPQRWANGNCQNRQIHNLDGRKTSNSQRKNSPKNENAQSHYGIVDFQKRLERLKNRKFKVQNEMEGSVGITGGNGKKPERGADGKDAEFGQKISEMERPTMMVAPSLGKKQTMNGGIVVGGGRGKTREPVEPLIVNHLSAIGELSGDEHLFDLNDGEVWREWDELSTECCSVQNGPNQMAAWHDGEVSEASFVLVRKRLKVAWEHRQLQQMRKLSLLRRESAGMAKETNNTAQSMVNMLETTKRNN